MHASPLGCMLNSTENLRKLFGFQDGGDIPELDGSKLCYRGHFTFCFESISRVGVGISRPASREECCCRYNYHFVLSISLHYHRAGALRFAESLLALQITQED